MPASLPSLLPLLFLSAAAALAGAGLLWRGIRGRRVDDHPLCRRCGFDLTGLPAGGGGSGRCPECGTDVAAARAVVIGHRRRRRGLIALGLALLVPAVLIGGGAAWWSASGFDPTPYKPVWLLMRQADAAPSPGADAARDELFRRLAAGKLAVPQVRSLTSVAVKRVAASPAAWPGRWGMAVEASLAGGNLSAAQIDAVTDRALAIQADAAVVWDAAWGDWVEQARAAGKVSDARWRRYARQAVGPLKMEVRPRVSADAEVLRVTFPNPTARVGWRSRLVLRSSDSSIRFGDGPWRDRPGGGSSGALLQTQSNGLTAMRLALDPFRAELTPGPLRLSIRRRVSVREGFRDAAPALVEWTEVFAADFTLLPAGEASASAVSDPSDEPAVLASIHIGRLGQAVRVPRQLELRIKCDGPPVDLAFDLYVRDASGRERKLTTVSAVAGRTLTTVSSGRAFGLTAEVVDLVLRPSREVAERSVDIANYWGRAVIFRGVKIWPDAAPGNFADLDPTPAEPLAGG